jgi:hypothetical protein
MMAIAASALIALPASVLYTMTIAIPLATMMSTAATATNATITFASLRVH